MASSTYNPGQAQVINLVSSDVEPTAAKKRSLEDDSESDSSHSGSTYKRALKRAKTRRSAKLDAERKSATSAEEGEIDEEEPKDSTVNGKDAGKSSASSKKRTKTPKPNAGWNPGISKTVLRTSLSKPEAAASVSKVSTPAGATPTSSSSSTSASAGSGRNTPILVEIAAAASAPADPRVFRQDSIDFSIPRFRKKKEGSWPARFQDWVRRFLNENPVHYDSIMPELAEAAYSYFIDNVTDLKPRKKRNAKQAAKDMETSGELKSYLQDLRKSKPRGQEKNSQTSQQAEKPVENSKSRRKEARIANGTDDAAKEKTSKSGEGYELRTSQPDDQPAEAIPSANEWASLLDESTKTNGSAGVSKTNGLDRIALKETTLAMRMAIPVGSVELEQQRRYFPSASDPTQMCLLCGQQAHTAANCPSLVCRFCSSQDHPELWCPSRVRCDKCRQLGHQADSCSEKLALTKEEGLACAVCDSPNHLEKECTEFWRSFHPEAGTINKVVFIPASCAMCGNGKHFSADCKRRRDDPPNPTWSIKNRDQYLDPDCGVEAIEESVGSTRNAKGTRGSDLRIRGHASRTTHVHYSESEDSEIEFLGRKPAQQRAAVGQIRLASNIQMPQDAAPRRSTYYDLRSSNQTPSQPPLPPGPPPSHGLPQRQGFNYAPPPGVAAYNSRAPANLPPPPSLPPRPPTRDYRNVPPPPPLQAPRGQLWQSNNGSVSQGGNKPRGGQRDIPPYKENNISAQPAFMDRDRVSLGRKESTSRWLGQPGHMMLVATPDVLKRYVPRACSHLSKMGWIIQCSWRIEPSTRRVPTLVLSAEDASGAIADEWLRRNETETARPPFSSSLRRFYLPRRSRTSPKPRCILDLRSHELQIGKHRSIANVLMRERSVSKHMSRGRGTSRGFVAREKRAVAGRDAMKKLNDDAGLG
ncbi:hypothetical protein G7046_g9618 [Stylonectria norvegica]|nr:hypothetical protein G7046_g9618 [Stylonectria norvegica]